MHQKNLSTPDDLDQAFQKIYDQIEAIADDITTARETMRTASALLTIRDPDGPELLILKMTDNHLVAASEKLREAALDTMVVYDPGYCRPRASDTDALGRSDGREIRKL